jgi:hypothetical protein
MNDRLGCSRRDFFLRLRSTEQGRALELSCRTLFMRCNDGTIAAAAEEYEPSMGEPPAVFERRTADDILTSLEGELQDVQVLRLLEPEWLEDIAGGDRLAEIIARFESRGGRVERQAESASP